MCRNIRTLFNFEPPATEDEIRAASLQFVRKISGFSKPSRANEVAFQSAVDEIARISGQLLLALESPGKPKNREDEMAKAKARTRSDLPHECDHDPATEPDRRSDRADPPAGGRGLPNRVVAPSPP